MSPIEVLLNAKFKLYILRLRASIIQTRKKKRIVKNVFNTHSLICLLEFSLATKHSNIRLYTTEITHTSIHHMLVLFLPIHIVALSAGVLLRVSTLLPRRAMPFYRFIVGCRL